MGTVYIFRGKAGTGKTTLANMLAEKLSIPVLCKDDVVDALKMTQDTDRELVNNRVCYNILYKIIQTNLDLKADFIMDIALGDRNNAAEFFKRLDFKDNKAVKFFVTCSDESEWRRRHTERIRNPLPHQVFTSIEHIIEHYKNADINPFEDEHIIDTANTLKETFEAVVKIVENGDI